MDRHSISERRACRVAGFPLATMRYKSCRDDSNLLQRMGELARKHPSYGHRRLHTLLLREGNKVNHKRTARLYYEVLKLSRERKKVRKKFRPVATPPVSCPSSPNEVWAMDFVSDQLLDGRRIRGLTVIDVFSRHCHRVEFDTSLTGARVTQTLDQICADGGYPRAIKVDNGPEFTSKALGTWAGRRRVGLQFSRPGKPTDNAFIESFNGRLREEFLNMHVFTTISAAREMVEGWRTEYNTVRPHSALGMRSPMEFVRQYVGKTPNQV